MKKILIIISVLFLVFGLYLPVNAIITTTSIITWTAPTTFIDGTPIQSGNILTYRVYKSPTPIISNSTMQLIANGVTSTTYTYNGMGCFAVSAVYNGVESNLSNVACKFIPNPPSGCSVK